MMSEMYVLFHLDAVVLFAPHGQHRPGMNLVPLMLVKPPLAELSKILATTVRQVPLQTITNLPRAKEFATPGKLRVGNWNS